MADNNNSNTNTSNPSPNKPTTLSRDERRTGIKKVEGYMPSDAREAYEKSQLESQGIPTNQYGTSVETERDRRASMCNTLDSAARSTHLSYATNVAAYSNAELSNAAAIRNGYIKYRDTLIEELNSGKTDFKRAIELNQEIDAANSAIDSFDNMVLTDLQAKADYYNDTVLPSAKELYESDAQKLTAENIAPDIAGSAVTAANKKLENIPNDDAHARERADIIEARDSAMEQWNKNQADVREQENGIYDSISTHNGYIQYIQASTEKLNDTTKSLDFSEKDTPEIMKARLEAASKDFYTTSELTNTYVQEDRKAARDVMRKVSNNYDDALEEHQTNAFKEHYYKDAIGDMKNDYQTDKSFVDKLKSYADRAGQLALYKDSQEYVESQRVSIFDAKGQRDLEQKTVAYKEYRGAAGMRHLWNDGTDKFEDAIYDGAEWYAKQTKALGEGINKAFKSITGKIDVEALKEKSEQSIKEQQEALKKDYDTYAPGSWDKDVQPNLDIMNDKDASFKEKVQALSGLASSYGVVQDRKEKATSTAHVTKDKGDGEITNIEVNEKDNETKVHRQRVEEAEQKFGGSGIPSSIQTDDDYDYDEP